MSAPTMPPQNRSGTSTVKCQSARDTIIQMRIAIARTRLGQRGGRATGASRHGAARTVASPWGAARIRPSGRAADPSLRRLADGVPAGARCRLGLMEGAAAARDPQGMTLPARLPQMPTVSAMPPPSRGVTLTRAEFNELTDEVDRLRAVH